ncbi:MAG: hypothetical protein U1A27_06105 [Phycisphaerae bacterium]
METRWVTVGRRGGVPAAVQSARTLQIMVDFGVPPVEPPGEPGAPLRVELGPGRIVALAGPSGSGKSAILRDIASQCVGARVVSGGEPAGSAAVVDGIGPGGGLAEALAVLTACGLCEPRLWTRRATALSDGERFRAALAQRIAEALAARTRPPIVCDEFGAVLHRRLALAIAFNLRKLVSRMGLTLIVATAHDDVLAELQPDTVVRLGGPAPQVTRGASAARPFGLRRGLRVERGAAGDYARFAPMHYRSRDGLGFVDRVFVLREGSGGESLGIVVFGMPPLELRLRNAATGGRFCRNPHRLNRELRTLRRLVMHPDVRGCGLGHWFVRRALPAAGVRFVECLSVMGAVNPVFERAGMRRIGRVAEPRGRVALLERMWSLGVEPYSARLAERIARCPRVRRLVLETIGAWRRATTSGGLAGYARRDAAGLAAAYRQVIGRPPVYYLWDRDHEFPRRAGRAVPRDGETARADAGRHDPAGVVVDREERAEAAGVVARGGARHRCEPTEADR